MAFEAKIYGSSGNVLDVDTTGRAEIYAAQSTAIATLAAVNATASIVSDGSATVLLDMRGTFSCTVQVQGTVDGTNWQIIPMRALNVAAVSYVASITGTTQGTWVGQCAGFRQVRAIVTAYTSGSVSMVLTGSAGAFSDAAIGLTTPLLVTSVGASGAAVTLTLPSPGAGLRQYLTYLSVDRFAAAVLTASATPVTVTTTNLPGSLAFTFPADAAALGTLVREREDFAFPVAASAQATAVTIVLPATTGVIWRATAGYYVAP